MKKLIAILLTFAMILLLATACAKNEGSESQTTTAPTPAADSTTETEATSSTDEEAPVRIGVQSYMTGANADIGKYINDAMELIENRINNQGGVLGRKIELVIEDCGSDQQTAINATTKQVADDSLSAIVGNASSAWILATDDMVESAKIPYVCCGSAAGLVEAQNPYFWIPRMTDDISGYIFAQFAHEELGMNDPAFIYMNNASGAGTCEKFVAAMKEMYDIDVTKTYAYNPDTDKDFSAFATQIVNSGCDGLLASSYQNDAGLIMRAIGEAGFDKPCLGANSAYADSVACEIAGEYANGWYCTADWNDATESPLGQEWAAEYEQAYGRKANLNAAVTTDAVLLLVNAIETAGSTDREAINTAMGQTKDFQGVTCIYTADGFNSMAQSLLKLQTIDGVPTVIGVVDRPTLDK